MQRDVGKAAGNRGQHAISLPRLAGHASTASHALAAFDILLGHEGRRLDERSVDIPPRFGTFQITPAITGAMSK